MWTKKYQFDQFRLRNLMVSFDDPQKLPKLHLTIITS